MIFRSIASPRAPRLACALGLLAGLIGQHVQAQPSPAEARARYQQDRAACLRGDTFQERGACLAEAAAVLGEAKRGRALVLPDQTYLDNRSLRCNALPEADREDCRMRMQGEGRTSGSVERGGLLRELERTLPAPGLVQSPPEK